MEDLRLNEEESPQNGQNDGNNPALVPKRRFCINEPANMDKFRYIEIALDDWLKSRGFTTKKAKQTKIVEMAIDMLFAKPEIEEIVGREQLQELLAQKVKKFF